MFFYEVAILATPNIFTYQSSEKLKLYSFVEIEVRSKLKTGFVIKEVSKPNFECKDIFKVSSSFLIESYFEIASFISSYYFSSLSESISLFTPFIDNQNLDKISIQTNITLSKTQNDALEFVKNRDVSIIFGDTGSGKTEIYTNH